MSVRREQETGCHFFGASAGFGTNPPCDIFSNSATGAEVRHRSAILRASGEIVSPGGVVQHEK
jgi:hypothetical protein